MTDMTAAQIEEAQATYVGTPANEDGSWPYEKVVAIATMHQACAEYATLKRDSHMDGWAYHMDGWAYLCVYHHQLLDRDATDEDRRCTWAVKEGLYTLCDIKKINWRLAES